MTLNGGPAGWRAVFPIEKHEFSAGCTKGRANTGRASELHIRADAQQSESTGCTKGRAGGLHNRARRRAAPKGGPTGCTTGRAAQQSGLEGCTSGRAAQQGGPAGCT